MDEDNREDFLESILAESYDTCTNAQDDLSTIRELSYSAECGSTTTEMLHNRLATRGSRQPSVISFDKKSSRK